MAITQADVDALEKAVMTGERSVEYDGRGVEFRSIEELLKALGYAKAALEATAAGGGKRRVSQLAPGG